MLPNPFDDQPSRIKTKTAITYAILITAYRDSVLPPEIAARVGPNQGPDDEIRLHKARRRVN